MRASLACAARLANTVFAGGGLRAPGVTLINYKGDSISKYICSTVIIYIARKITKSHTHTHTHTHVSNDMTTINF